MSAFTSTLYQGLTRPAMLFGVALPYFVINIMVNLIIFLATLSWASIFWLFPLGHGVAVVSTRIDPHWLSIMTQWVRQIMIRAQQGDICYEP